MAWMTSHLFVQCTDAAQVEQTLAELLEQPEHRTDLGDFSDLPSPMVVCPPQGGWVAVTGVGAWFDDVVWVAGRLAATCRQQAISSEVFGNCYRLRLSVHRDGEQARLLRSPEGEPDDSGPMPLYEDVELVAFTTLCELGIPSSLIAVGTAPFGADGTVEIGPAVTLLRRGEEVLRGELQVKLPVLKREDPPVLPARTGQGFELMLFEDRYLEGQPGEASLERLFELEQAFTDRARRCRGDDTASTFTYYCGEHQERLNTMLQAHDHHTLPTEQRVQPPWWQFWRQLGKWR